MVSGEGVLPSGRHDLGHCAPSNYWRDQRGQLHCAHGVILYGTSCVQCERSDYPPFARPGETEAFDRAEREFGFTRTRPGDLRAAHDHAVPIRVYKAPRPEWYETGMRDFEQAVPPALMALITAYCVVLTQEREPNQVIGRRGSPYMDRWYLARKLTVPVSSIAPDYIDSDQRMPSELENLYLHSYRRADADVPHDHPWANASLVVRGWYREAIYSLEGKLLGSNVRRPGDIVLREARSVHAIVETGDNCLSLFATLPKERDWGFHTADGFVPWTEFGNP